MQAAQRNAAPQHVLRAWKGEAEVLGVAPALKSFCMKNSASHLLSSPRADFENCVSGCAAGAEDADIAVFRFTLGIPGFDDAQLPRVVGILGAALLIANNLSDQTEATAAQASPSASHFCKATCQMVQSSRQSHDSSSLICLRMHVHGHVCLSLQHLQRPECFSLIAIINIMQLLVHLKSACEQRPLCCSQHSLAYLHGWILLS